MPQLPVKPPFNQTFNQMWAAPLRQATATAPGEILSAAGAELPQQVLVHRNQLNEQHRPGTLVTIPMTFAPAKGEKLVTRWVRTHWVPNDAGRNWNRTE